MTGQPTLASQAFEEPSTVQSDVQQPERPSPDQQHRVIPFSPPSITKAEIKAVTEVLRSGWLSIGPKTVEFEKKFASYVGAKHAILTNSCTSALFASLLASGIKAGDEVIVPTLTFAACANVCVHLGAKPVLADVCEDTLCIDPQSVRSKITEKTRAIMPVHYGGHPAEMKEINEIAREKNIRVIEDAAHAAGAEYDNKKVGCGDNLTCFSFYATKNLTTGEGGMITLEDDALADRLRVLRLHGMNKDAWKRYTDQGSWYYEIVEAGYKFNSTDINAALGLVQLSRLDKMNRERERIAKAYSKAFNGIFEIVTPKKRRNIRHAWHLYPIRLESVDRNAFIEKLKAAGIGTSVHFIPIHLMPYYRDHFGYKQRDLPVAEKAYNSLVSLPIYPGLKKDSVAYVIETVKKSVGV
ncbi:DegT/DnrJ/EryC1/StrS family aminotransferase [archaeon]|nr:DegT/DnrJ/EryC1/StrS family aminotransferase [archaeon]